ncbi:Secreted beta-glucosidase sun1 [Mactra antiquata]
MRRKSSKGRRSKTITKLLSGNREETKVEEKIVQVIHKTPEKSSDYDRYLCDETWDINPKTDYTYARTGSYSPRYLGRKWVTPNMSRYRIRYKGGTSSARSDIDYDGYISSEYSDDDRVTTDDILDTDSDISYERVLEDGIELRSGKNLKTMREILHEHDQKLEQSEIMQSTSRHAYTTSKLETKTRSRRDVYNENTNAQTRSTGNRLNKELVKARYTQSEQKQGRYSGVGSYQSSRDDFEYGNVDYSGVRSRRNLNTDFSNSRRLQEQQQQYTGNGVDTRTNKSRSGYDEVDNRMSRSGYTITKVTKTVSEEYLDSDRDVTEKGSVEASEKDDRARRISALNSSSNNVNLYGLDSEVEFSDTDTTSTKRSTYSTSSNSRNGRNNTDLSTHSNSTITTIVTTVTETVSIFTSPVWNTIGRPARDYVVQPLISAVMSVLYVIWLLATRPFMYLVQSIRQLCSWLMSSRFDEILSGVVRSPLLLLTTIQYVSWQLIMMDTWLFKRRNGRRCCLCLPLLLILPFLLMLLTGYDIMSERSTLLGLFQRDTTYIPTPLADTEKQEYFSQLNAEVKNIILQLQTNQQKEQLTTADVEAIVYRIVAKENNDLKSNLQGSQNEALINQAQWKIEQEAKLTDMQDRHNVLVASINDLESSIDKHRAVMADSDATMKEESSQHILGLEEKLTALHMELQDLDKAYAALLARVNACCHNETYYATAVKDNVNAILAEMMKGHMSGNPTQDAFTEWLHSNYVSRDVLDERLKDLASDLTSSVLVMIKELQESQQQQYIHLEQQQQEIQNSQQQHVHVTADGASIGEQVYQVRRMIEEALLKYSSDKTGIADYALESAGGVVVSTRCSESYYRKTALVSVFGVPLWYTSNSPRTVIQPEVYPGQCWAFKGVEGYLVIKTSTIVTPSGFTLEHIPKSLAPTGEIDSAPKDFTVLGLQSEYDTQGISLGNYTYDDNGNPMQFFPIQVKSDVKPFNLFELKIQNNYGNRVYTCLYRFRIHGTPYRK